MHRCPRARHLLGLAFLAVGPALILHGCRAPAPAGGPHWIVSSPADSVGVGDPFAVVFEGVWPDSVGSAHLVWPVAADSLAVLRRDSTAVATRVGSRGMRYELTAVALRPGVQRLPPAALVSARGRTVAVAAVAPVLARGRIGDPAKAQLAPLAPLVRLRGFPWAAAAAALAAVLLAGFVWMRLRRRVTAAVAAQPLVPPAVEFERGLERLRALGLAQRGEMRAFAQELSWTLRRYLGRRWERPALEATRPEIVRWLPETRLCLRDQGELGAWLERTDRIKFAGEMPLETEAEELAERAAAMVRRTEEIFAAEEAARREAAELAAGRAADAAAKVPAAGVESGAVAEQTGGAASAGRRSGAAGLAERREGERR